MSFEPALAGSTTFPGALDRTTSEDAASSDAGAHATRTVNAATAAALLTSNGVMAVRLSLRTGVFEAGIARRHLAATEGPHLVCNRPRDVAHLFLNGCIAIEAAWLGNLRENSARSSGGGPCPFRTSMAIDSTAGAPPQARP